MKADQIKNIACIGAGTIGSGWAAYFLWKGFPVTVHDRTPQLLERSGGLIKQYLEIFVNNDLMSPADFDQAQKRVKFTLNVGEAVKDAQFIQEAVFESYEVKQALLKEVDAAAPTAIFGSSTSGLLMTEIQKFSKYPGRCITTHPYNPPHLIPLVELVRGKLTTDETLETTYNFYKSIGKIPVTVLKEVPGHIASRITMAVFRECADLVLKGVCSVEDVDRAVCYGPGLRYALLGPHMIYHLGGGDGGIKGLIENIGSTANVWMEDMAKWTTIPAEAKDILQAGVDQELAGRPAKEIAAWRDANLIEILKLLGRLQK